MLALGALLTFAACDTVDPGLDAVNPLDPAADGPLGGITAAPSFDFATSQPVDVVLHPLCYPSGNFCALGIQKIILEPLERLAGRHPDA